MHAAKERNEYRTPAPQTWAKLFLAGTFSQIAGGASHSCAVDNVGAFQCWGSNDKGQSGPPSLLRHQAWLPLLAGR